MSVDIEQLRLLLDVLAEKDIAEFEHEDEKVRFKIVRIGKLQPATAFATSVGNGGGASTTGAGTSTPTAGGAASEVPSDSVDVTSPFVGTFYRAPSPDTPSFVEVGSVVRHGQTLCIIEAMKLMNEIEAESSGTIVEIFAQNGKAVEYGQKLFRIKRA